MLLQYALFLAESAIYANLHHDTAPTYITILLKKYGIRVKGRLNTLNLALFTSGSVSVQTCHPRTTVIDRHGNGLGIVVASL